MVKFFAILKDSFREAIDGFVIYLMLAMSLLVILVVASISFTPSPPEQAFESILDRFQIVFPDQGRSRVLTISPNVKYSASDVREEGGGYKLRLTATGQPNATVPDDKGTNPDLSKGDSFREAVAGWSRPAGNKREVEKAGKKVEFGAQSSGTPEELRAVTDAQMEAFVRGQFAVHAEMDATVKRVKEGVEEPTYAFDVTTTGGSSVRGWPHTMKMFFGAVTVSRSAPLGMVLYMIEDQIMNGLGAVVALLISMIITAFFIPNMLRKGSVDLLISKPIGRAQLLVYKYVGGLTFIFLVTAVSVGGVWLALAVRSGHWDPSFLIVIPVLTFTFAILYAVSTLVAVFTRSAIAAMLVSVGFAFFLFLVGQVKSIFDRLKIRQDEQGGTDIPEWAFTLVDTINNALPRYKDLDKLTSKLIADGTLTAGESRMFGLAQMEYPSWGSTFGVSFVFIAIMLAISCWWFSRKDY